MAGALLSAPDIPSGTPLLGIDIGGTGLKLGLVLSGPDPVLLGVDVLAGHPAEDPARAIERLSGAALALLRAHGVAPGDVFSIGVGCAGLIDTRNGVLRMSPNLPAWRDVPLRQGIEEKIARPVRLVNDAEAFLHSEWRFGAARGASNALFVTLGTGVGGGLVLGGRPFRGPTGLGGEIGHMSIDLNGPPCPCGNLGCLELFVGRRAIEKAAAEAGFPEADWSPARLAARADQGDDRAILIYGETGRRLGIAIAGLVNLLEPEIVVIGGGISGSSHLFLPDAREEMMKRSMVARHGSVRLEAARFGPASGMMGAALLSIADL